MHSKLSKLRDKRARGDNGFTLIELLVVVVIIGILIAIAIPLYLNYKKGANDKAAQSDVRGAISVFEQCNSDNSFYPQGVSTAGVITGCVGQTQAAISTGTTLTYFVSTTAPSTAAAPLNYIIEAKNSGGSGAIYCYASAAGGSVKKSTAVAAYAGVCP